VKKKYSIDAATGLGYLVSQLTHIESKMYEVKYKNITYPNIIPVSNEAGEWAESVTYFFMDGRGVAKFVGSKSLDVPIAEVGTDKVVVPVELAATGYEYSDEELRQAVHLGKPLTQMNDTLLLPTAQWSYIASTPRSDNSDMTILQYIVANSPYLNSESDVIPVSELAGAGAGATDRMMAYTKDVEKVVFHIPMPLRFTEPQRKGRGFEVPGEFKLSGVEFRYPGSARYADGI